MKVDRIRFLFISICSICICIPLCGIAQVSGRQPTKADILRGTITPQRAWWQVNYYDLHVTLQQEDSSVTGYNNITYRVIDMPQKLQIDLQEPLIIDDIEQNNKKLSYERIKKTNAYFVEVPKELKLDSLYTLKVHYHGTLKGSKNSNWGFNWAQDSLGNLWVTTSVQGSGASVWWPNKDHQSAEPDSMSINITVPDPMVDVSNGRLRGKTRHENGSTTWSWFVSNPINNYNVAINAGNYVNFTDTFMGKKGRLNLSYWVLKQHKKLAERQFKQVKPMLSCFEKWFGPYPFYEDSYKLVEVPYLGMEHQSAVAYGNHYDNGYLSTDLSGTGWGLKWDYIIIHESAHEWWGNSITAKDPADLWIHESFADYAESIYTECKYGKEAGAEYTIGLRKKINNNYPIIGHYGINKSSPDEDRYFKGNSLLHMIRQIIDNDIAWRNILHGLQKAFFHQTVTSRQVEDYINGRTDYDFSPVFDQYLRHAEIPTFQYYINNSILYYRWANTISGFNMPIKVRLSKDSYSFIYPSGDMWKKAELFLKDVSNFIIDKNFYVRVQKLPQ